MDEMTHRGLIYYDIFYATSTTRHYYYSFILFIYNKYVCVDFLYVRYKFGPGGRATSLSLIFIDLM